MLMNGSMLIGMLFSYHIHVVLIKARGITRRLRAESILRRGGRCIPKALESFESIDEDDDNGTRFFYHRIERWIIDEP